MKPVYLYHGSNILVDDLIPNKAYGFGGNGNCLTGVYVVERKALAIPFCFKLINIVNDSSFNIATDKKIPDVIIQNCEIDWEHEGYLYKVKANTFESVDCFQWVSKKAVKPVEITIIEPKEYRLWVTENRA